VEQLCGQNGLWALYNNAGITVIGEIEWASMKDFQRVMDINAWGSVRVTKSVLHLIRQSQGRVVTMTSGLSRAVAPGRSPYCVSKFALEAFMDCLRYEMEKFGVKCSTIQPGNLSGATKVLQGAAEQVTNLFGQIEPHIKEAYGEEYLKKFVAISVQSHKAIGGPTNSIQPVIDDIRHAVMSQTPRIRYQPAQMSSLIWRFCYNLLPEHLTHIYMTKYRLRKFPKPASMVGRD